MSVKHQVSKNLPQFRALARAEPRESLDCSLKEILVPRHSNECGAVTDHSLRRDKYVEKNARGGHATLAGWTSRINE